MRLAPVLDAFYVLGSLWTGGLCTSAPDAGVQSAHHASWSDPGRPVDVTAFVDVAVVPMDTERVLLNQTVLVQNGRVTALGPVNQIKIPDGATRIDGRGKYLIPGLGNMHPHGRLSEAKLPTDASNWLFSELASGVTTTRHIIGGTLTPSQAGQYLASGKTPIPRLSLSPKIRGTDGPAAAARLDSVGLLVAAAKAEGYHHIGIQLSGTRVRAGDKEVYTFLDSLLAAARRVGLPVADHDSGMPFDSTLKLGSTGGSTEHLYGYWRVLGFGDRADEAWTSQPLAEVPVVTIQAAAAATKRAGLWVTPTLSCTEYKHSLPPAHRERVWSLLRALQDAGVGLLLSGDDGGDIFDELTSMVRAGLTPYQALLTGTRNVAAFYKLQDSTGTIAVGKRADLVLLPNNPLADIRHVREPVGVMVDGRWLDRAALDQHLLADPKNWLNSALDVPSITYALTEEQRKKLWQHARAFPKLIDSLTAVKPKSEDYERILQRITAELGAMRSQITTPGPQLTFDTQVRVWMREQNRQGYRVTVAGVTLTP